MMQEQTLNKALTCVQDRFKYCYTNLVYKKLNNFKQKYTVFK